MLLFKVTAYFRKGKMKNQNEQLTKLYDQFKNEGLAQEEKILATARAEAASLLEETRKKIASEMKTAQETLRTQVPQLSGEIASRVLGRNIG